MTYAYFSRFPTIEFETATMVDITRRIKLLALGKQSIVGFEKYNIKDGDSPESIAFKYYGDSGYHFLILIANDIIDPYYDWPLQDGDLKLYVTNKYGIGHENDIHHWEPSSLSTLPQGTILDELSVDEAYRVPISNYAYEDEVNESKRAIRLIKPAFLSGLILEFTQKIVT